MLRLSKAAFLSTSAILALLGSVLPATAQNESGIETVTVTAERREERTTEGGLDAAGQHNHLAYYVDKLGAANIRVSLFIEPDPAQIAAAVRLGAPVVEFHTGRYAHVEGEARAAELRRIADAAALAVKNGIEPHAGHGLTFDNVQPVAAIPQLAELNIGHFLIGEAIFTSLIESVQAMRAAMDRGVARR
jgi:pyridoxine 5-phosphate synthase